MVVRLVQGLDDRKFLPSDKFYIWTVCRPNCRNDRIWTKNIEENQRYREMEKNQSCIGVLIMFTCQRLLYVIKESLTGEYFRDRISPQNIFHFLKNEENVIDPDEALFIDDGAACMRANKNQDLLQGNDV